MGQENKIVEQGKEIRNPTEILNEVVTGVFVEKVTFGDKPEEEEGAMMLPGERADRPGQKP